MQDFRKLEIYQGAKEFCGDIYKFCVVLPKNEQFGLISQIKRAVTSITLNIAEGSGCDTNSEFFVFVSYAYRSCNEVLACLELIEYLNLCNQPAPFEELGIKGVRLSRMIYSFSKKLKNKET